MDRSAATFVIINGFLWFIDLQQGGLDWAYWVTVSWGIAMAFHAAWYFITERGVNKYERSLCARRPEPEPGVGPAGGRRSGSRDALSP
jgi:hypothetical protein